MNSQDREAALYAALDALGIAHRTVEHAATFTAAEGAAVKAGLVGALAKTLLVTDGAALFLLVATGAGRADMRAARGVVGARRRLSFASPEALMMTLGVRPGTATPYALMAEGAGAITSVVLDEALFAHEAVWLHPMRNTASTGIAPDDLVRFCEAQGHPPILCPLTPTNPSGAA